MPDKFRKSKINVIMERENDFVDNNSIYISAMAHIIINNDFEDMRDDEFWGLPSNIKLLKLCRNEIIEEGYTETLYNNYEKEA